MSEGSKEPGGATPASHTGWVVLANLLAVLALVVAVAALVLHFVDENGEGGAPAAAANPTATAQATPTAPAVVEVSVDDDPSWGPENAPVTIVEFSDFL
jgi:protein-disulfide isomerase